MLVEDSEDSAGWVVLHRCRALLGRTAGLVVHQRVLVLRVYLQDLLGEVSVYAASQHAHRLVHLVHRQQ